MNPQDLPVYKQKEKILETLAGNRVIVVESPTGSGKTTQIPKILFENGYGDSGIIGVTQPRRIAAVSVSEYIAGQLGRTIPNIIGYKMRFEDQTDTTTRIKIMTDGILLQEIKADYYLSKYSLIMVDEAHERSLNIDFILGLLKRILSERKDFKVIISSATINAEVFSEYFDQCPIVKIDNQAYPVNTVYDPPKPENDYDTLIQKIIEIVSRTVSEKRKGDILVFLQGERAIRDCIFRLSELKSAKQLEIIPLFARLSSQDQQKAFLSYPGKRKVIVATNIAETSVTIDGITVVIDPGLAKINFYNQRTFTSSLVETPISRASCNQRKGRAGRTAPGICYRLYERGSYEARALFTLEEILRTDLSEVVLRMAEIGIKDFESFDFLSPPGKQGIISAIETLRLLDALDEERALTNVGKMMVRFPMLPKHSRIIVEAILSYPQVLEEAIIAASFLTTNTPFLLPLGEEMEARKAHHAFRDPYGDFISYLNILRAFQKSRDSKAFCRQSYLDLEIMNEILNIKCQLEEIVSEIGIPILSGGPIGDYLCAVSKGLIQFVCIRSGKGIYRSLTAGKIFIHPGSVMYQENPQYIVAGEIVKTTRMYARSVSKLKAEWLRRISSLLYDSMVKSAARAQSAVKARNFTTQIRIGSQIFRIEKEKGKRTVILEWQTLKKTLKDIDPLLAPNYKNLRGKIVYEGFEFLSGMRLNSLLNLAGKVNPEGRILKACPRKNFAYPESADYLCRELKKLLFLCPRRKKTKQLGFLTLYTDREGNYWLKSIKGFHTALSESLASLETLADESSAIQDRNQITRINETYRKLSALL